MPDEPVQIEGDFEVVKKADADQNIFGWAVVSVRKDGTIVADHQNDVVDIDELELAAYDFVLDFRETGDMHKGDAHGRLIETMVFTPEKIEKLGIPEGTVPLGWWTGFHIDSPEAYEAVTKGDRTMFSIEGTGIREPSEIDVDIEVKS